MAATIDQLTADNEALTRNLGEAKNVNNGLLQKLKDAEQLAADRQEFIERAGLAQGDGVTLLPIREGSPTRRYDGLPDEFVFHEETQFRDDTGYDLSVIYDRAIGTVDRAILNPDRGLGRLMKLSVLPPFDKGLALNVKIWIAPVEGSEEGD